MCTPRTTTGGSNGIPYSATIAAGATAAKGGANAYFANQQRQALLSSQRD